MDHCWEGGREGGRGGGGGRERERERGREREILLNTIGNVPRHTTYIILYIQGNIAFMDCHVTVVQVSHDSHVTSPFSYSGRANQSSSQEKK